MRPAQHTRILRKLLTYTSSILATLVIVLATGPLAAAQTYGCGTYGAGNYNTGSCGTTTATNVGSTTLKSDATTPPAPAGSILLNSFSEFSSSAGKQLDVNLGEVLYFNLGGNQHTITVKSIDGSQVIVTIASTPTDVTVPMGQTVPYDVDMDGKPDISLTLGAVNANAATVNFRLLALPAISPGIGSLSNTPADASPSKSVNLWWLWLILVLVGIGLVIWAIIAARRHKAQNNNVPGNFGQLS